jgi:hypothetical protein
MYTGRVVRLRSFACVLALVLTASPVLRLVCLMDCDQVAATPTCHESTTSADGPTVRGAHHACNHDHSTGSPALLANAGARDSVANFAGISVPTVARAWAPEARVAILAIHGPPGLSGRSTSFHTIVLRI